MRKPTFLWICLCCQLLAKLSGQSGEKKYCGQICGRLLTGFSYKGPKIGLPHQQFFCLYFSLIKNLIHWNLHWILHRYVFNVGSTQIILKNAILKKDVPSAAEFYGHSNRIILKTLATLAGGQINAGKFSYRHTYFKGKQRNVLLSTC